MNEIHALQKQFQNIAKNPKTIVNVAEDINNIKGCSSYFYRKFSPQCNI
jgi:hypothetical protein